MGHWKFVCLKWKVGKQCSHPMVCLPQIDVNLIKPDSFCAYKRPLLWVTWSELHQNHQNSCDHENQRAQLTQHSHTTHIRWSVQNQSFLWLLVHGLYDHEVTICIYVHVLCTHMHILSELSLTYTAYGQIVRIDQTSKPTSDGYTYTKAHYSSSDVTKWSRGRSLCQGRAVSFGL